MSKIGAEGWGSLGVGGGEGLMRHFSVTGCCSAGCPMDKEILNIHTQSGKGSVEWVVWSFGGRCSGQYCGQYCIGRW